MRNRKVIFITSFDYYGKRAIELIAKNDNNNIIIIDNSNNFKRILKILKKGKIKILTILKIIFAEILRNIYGYRKYRNIKISNFFTIKSNNDLLIYIKKYKPDCLLLYRAGLIISKEILNLDISILNIHCANIPEFGGLGSIEKALEKKQYLQNAVLHEVTSSIDSGKVLMKQKYKLNKNFSYFRNENIAYEAGLILIKKILDKKDFLKSQFAK